MSFKEYIVIYEGKEKKFDTYEDALKHAQKNTFVDYVMGNDSMSLLMIRTIDYKDGGENNISVDMRIIHWLDIDVCEIVKFDV